MKFIKYVLIVSVSFLFFSSAQGQLTTSEMKVYKKCEKLFKKEKYQEAAELFEPIVVNHPEECNVWPVLIKYRYAQYQTAKKHFRKSGQITITTSKNTSTKKMAEELMNSLQSILNYTSIEFKYIGTLKSAALKCESNSTIEIYLRMATIDKLYNPDTAISSEAWEFCAQAEQYFAAKDYDESIKYFKKALALEPDFKQAMVHLGDCYYMQKRYEKSAEYFRQAANKWPKLLDAQKYLTDALMNNGDFEEARDAAIEGIKRYPDSYMFMKYASATKEMEAEIDKGWVPRQVAVSKYKNTHYLIASKPSYSWNVYSDAKNDIGAYCDSITGIIHTANTFTSSPYLEVYSWEKMLKSADKEEFAFAREMQEKGYLDCYVLLSLFHVDLYDQQQDFVSKNPEKVKEYMEMLMKKNKN